MVHRVDIDKQVDIYSPSFLTSANSGITKGAGNENITIKPIIKFLSKGIMEKSTSDTRVSNTAHSKNRKDTVINTGRSNSFFSDNS